MKRIFICSPFRSCDESKHHLFLAYAKELCQFAFNQGHAPFAPHLLYPQFLDDSNPIERSQGMRAALTFLSTCQELWYGSGFGISEGMKQEIKHARYGIGIPVREVIREAGSGQFIFAE